MNETSTRKANENSSGNTNVVVAGDVRADTLENTTQKLFSLASKMKCTTNPRPKDSINSRQERRTQCGEIKKQGDIHGGKTDKDIQ